MDVAKVEVSVRQRPARVFAGGAGSALLLVHGGWSGAQMHWSRVWGRLAERHHVLAPDLPGLGDLGQPPLASVRAYAEWLLELLDVFGVERAWCVGNSFGASVAWSLAGRAPGRCAGVVLVDGIPMPRTPLPLRVLGRTAPARALMRRLVRRASYRPALIARAFADPTRAPPELARSIAEEWDVIAKHFADLLIAGDGPPAPRLKPLLLFGAADRLPGTTPDAARRLQRTLRGSTLVQLADAGHFPQVEAPEAFVAALEDYVG